MFMYNISDIIVISLLVIGLLLLLTCFIIATVRMSLCKHDKTYVSQITLDEICRKCQKNLGFVGRNKDNKK